MTVTEQIERKPLPRIRWVCGPREDFYNAWSIGTAWGRIADAGPFELTYRHVWVFNFQCSIRRAYPGFGFGGQWSIWWGA